MALFSKPPAKKPAPPPSARPVPPAPPRPASARELAAHAHKAKARHEPIADPAGVDVTVSGESLMEFSPQQTSFEVVQANPGLCAVLENAALLYASGQDAQARSSLEQGVQNDADTKSSPLAWLALFDLMQRANDKTAFDQLALQYVVQFERSAPAWEERVKPQIGPKAAPTGYIAVTGKLTAASNAQLIPLQRAIEKGVTQARLDLAPITGFDDDGARLLAKGLAAARRSRIALQIQRPEKLRLALEAMVKKGREGGEGAWLLSLELLQWMHDQDRFDDRAIEYAVEFELSPPSWEPPPQPLTETADHAAGAPAEETPESLADLEMLMWTGSMVGSALSHFSRLAEFAQRRSIVPVDMSGVDRVDFVCAGALLNGINRIETQRKSVQLVGASPIIRALLLLIGISPRHFVKKAT